jgi:hypothetical protein
MSRLTVNASVSTHTDVCKKKAAKTERLKKFLFCFNKQVSHFSFEKPNATTPEHQESRILCINFKKMKLLLFLIRFSSAGEADPPSLLGRRVVVINPAEELVHFVGSLRANDNLLHFFVG